jgi:hypothetical protein
MRSIICGMAVLGALALTSAAELTLRLKLEYSRYLIFAPVHAVVTVHNQSGQTFGFYETPGEAGDRSLSFLVERKPGGPAPRLDNGPVVKALRLLPGEKRQVMRDLSLWFDFTDYGSYTVTVTADWHGRRFESNTARLDIVSGLPILSVRRSVPRQPNVIRRFTLSYLARGGKEQAFLSVTSDAGEKSFGCFGLGPIVRVFRPVMDFDAAGTLRVVHQSGGDRYTRSTFRFTGDVVVFMDQDYFGSDGLPYGRVEEMPVEPVPEPRPGFFRRVFRSIFRRRPREESRAE